MCRNTSRKEFWRHFGGENSRAQPRRDAASCMTEFSMRVIWDPPIVHRFRQGTGAPLRRRTWVGAKAHITGLGIPVSRHQMKESGQLGVGAAQLHNKGKSSQTPRMFNIPISNPIPECRTQCWAVSRSDSEKQSRLWLITYTDTHNVTEFRTMYLSSIEMTCRLQLHAVSKTRGPLWVFEVVRSDCHASSAMSVFE